jgi:8-oxo-dGTP pyrophosphatase MutT (NUDIX family)
MSYLEEIRKRVGHLPLLLVGATVLVIDEHDRLLLLERVDNKAWGPPGGITEPGEVVEEAAAREMLEETGLQASSLTLFGVFSGDGQHYLYPNGDEVHFVNIAYLCRRFSGEVCISDEHTGWRWFEINDLPGEISPPVIPILDRLSQDLQKREI